MRVPRRTLIRAGVTSAWTTPLVAIGVPANAAGCSGGVTLLTAQEVAGSRQTSIDSGTGLIEVNTSVQLTNAGVAGQLASASVSGTLGESMLSLSISTAALGTVASATVPEPGDPVVTAMATKTLLLGSPVVLVNFRCGDVAAIQTFEVSFQPDCGLPAVCSFTVVFEGDD